MLGNTASYGKKKKTGVLLASTQHTAISIQHALVALITVVGTHDASLQILQHFILLLQLLYY